MKQNAIREKSYAFAVRIINLNRYLVTHKKDFVLSKQSLRSGTSIGANVEEALGAQSTKDVIAKLHIALIEARETNYWLRLLKHTKYIDDKEFNSINNDCAELLKILNSIIITTKSTKILNS
jgi:four helix bundle protein